MNACFWSVIHVTQWSCNTYHDGLQEAEHPSYLFLPLPLPLFFTYTSLSQSVSLTCPCPSASICPASHFGKHNLFWLSVVLDLSLMLCVFVRVFLGKRHHKQWSHGTLYEPLDCVMFVYLACLPPHRFVCVCVCGLARFAGYDARLSWWICILAKRMDKGRDAGGTRVRVGGFGRWLQGC